MSSRLSPVTSKMTWSGSYFPRCSKSSTLIVSTSSAGSSRFASTRYSRSAVPQQRHRRIVESQFVVQFIDRLDGRVRTIAREAKRSLRVLVDFFERQTCFAGEPLNHALPWGFIPIENEPVLLSFLRLLRRGQRENGVADHQREGQCNQSVL